MAGNFTGDELFEALYEKPGRDSLSLPAATEKAASNLVRHIVDREGTSETELHEFCELLASRLQPWPGKRDLEGPAAVRELAVWCGLRFANDYPSDDPVFQELVQGLRSLAAGDEWSARFRVETRRTVDDTHGAQLGDDDNRHIVFSFSDRCVYDNLEVKAELAPSVEAELADPYERLLREDLFDAASVALEPKAGRLPLLVHRVQSLVAPAHGLESAVDFLIEFDAQLREAITNEMIQGIEPPSLSALAESTGAEEDFRPLLAPDSRPYSELPSPPDFTYYFNH